MEYECWINVVSHVVYIDVAEVSVFQVEFLRDTKNTFVFLVPDIMKVENVD